MQQYYNQLATDQSGDAILQIQNLYQGDTDIKEIDDIVDDYRGDGVVYKTNITKKSVLDSYNDAGSAGLRAQFQRWVDYMKSISNSFDVPKYNMILNQQFLRIFAPKDQYEQLQQVRNQKRNEKMAAKMDLIGDVGGIIIHRDNAKQYYYTTNGNGTYVLLGKKLLKGMDRQSNEYITLQQYILANSLKSMQTQANKKQNSRPTVTSNKKKAKAKYLQNSQLTNTRRLYKKGKLTFGEYRTQGDNYYNKYKLDAAAKITDQITKSGDLIPKEQQDKFIKGISDSRALRNQNAAEGQRIQAARAAQRQ